MHKSHERLTPWQEVVLLRLEAIERKVAKMHEEMNAFFARMDKATSDIAARLEKLATDPALPADIKAKLETEIATLEAMGKDPANPLPPTP